MKVYLPREVVKFSTEVSMGSAKLLTLILMKNPGFKVLLNVADSNIF